VSLCDVYNSDFDSSQLGRLLSTSSRK